MKAQSKYKIADLWLLIAISGGIFYLCSGSFERLSQHLSVWYLYLPLWCIIYTIIGMSYSWLLALDPMESEQTKISPRYQFYVTLVILLFISASIMIGIITPAERYNTFVTISYILLCRIFINVGVRLYRYSRS